jgi:hypothetical protein
MLQRPHHRHLKRQARMARPETGQDMVLALSGTARTSLFMHIQVRCPHAPVRLVSLAD